MDGPYPPLDPNRMLVHERKMWVLLMEMAWFVVVNGVTLGLFLFKRFEWEQEREKENRSLCGRYPKCVYVYQCVNHTIETRNGG